VRDSFPIAFYAPMKSPDHPSPSGDRTMARLLMKALRRAGFAPALASKLRTWDGRGDAAFQNRTRADSLGEAERLIKRWRASAEFERPRLWFTYHVYYKAPDWVGPRVADALKVPYIVAEASRAGKRAGGAWALAHEGAEAALDRADVVFSLTGADREALERNRHQGQRILDLPPFIDFSEWPAPALKPSRIDLAESGRPPRLLSVAMMRAGDKLASYRVLAKALTSVSDQPWTIDIVGDGEARAEVERVFARLGDRITLHGRIEERATLAALYRCADLFVWPAVNEAYGMVLLEAQAFGCPVLAGGYAGVASVVSDGRTGVLAAPGDAAAFAAALRPLLRDPARRRRFGAAARSFVTTDRGVEHAANRLRDDLLPLMAEAALP
jgi:glycosyltransferase involved in cell wall biosynthesis